MNYISPSQKLIFILKSGNPNNNNNNNNNNNANIYSAFKG